MKAPSARPRSPQRSMSWLSRAPGTVRSAPKAMPDTAHTTRKPVVSPAPKPITLTNASTDKPMPSAQLRNKPRRSMTLSHSGNDKAPAAKYSPKNKGSMAWGACKRSCTKNSTSVAGTALARPLSMNTANRRRKPGCFQGCHKLGASCTALCDSSDKVLTCMAVRRQLNKPKPSMNSNKAVVGPQPHKAGKADANNTPTKAKPSRQATQRLCARPPPPCLAAQAWCKMPNPL